MNEKIKQSLESLDGWQYFSADFSIQASGQVGLVLLVRSPDEQARWHEMPEDLKDDPNVPPLYVSGSGLTFEEAFENAIKAAVVAKPIPRYD